MVIIFIRIAMPKSNLSNGKEYFSLPEFEKKEGIKISRLPFSIRIMLESLIRNCDGKTVTKQDIIDLARWQPGKKQEGNIPFVVSRVILQDFTGVPLLVDLAAMRDALAAKGHPAKGIEPQVPVDLVIDHSVQVDRSGTSDAFDYNLVLEFERNRERYAFLKWGQQAFKTFKVFPPGIGIVHQVNLEHIATVVTQEGNICFPDTLVGTDSHTTMINGLGVVGWGVGGIEAEAAMLKQPVFTPFPEVVGVHLSGKLKEGVTATDLTLRITEMLRKEQVVGKFVEFFGEGAASLTVADRATIGNMAPEYGATIGYFAVDEKTLDYLRLTGRSEAHIKLTKEYFTAQKMFGVPKKGDIDYSQVLELNLNEIEPCVSGPKRPQDRINLGDVKQKFKALLKEPHTAGGYGLSDAPLPKICVNEKGVSPLDASRETGGIPDLDGSVHSWGEEEMVTNKPITDAEVNPGYGDRCSITLTHGSIVIAAITSCTNTSNPSVMLGAGLLAKKAVEKGLKVNPMIKTSLAPGSRVVADYLAKAGLDKALNALGFHLVAYGCTTCIGNSGPLEENIEEAIQKHNLVAASVLSGNRNFEARIHGDVKANFLMSPPLVVAFALAGKIDIDLNKEPLGLDKERQPVYLKDIWPSPQEIEETMSRCIKPEMFQTRYAHIEKDSSIWNEIGGGKGVVYAWDKESTYIQNPPYFSDFHQEMPKETALTDLRALSIFGDSVTTDHISPAGSIREDSPAGQYLISKGIDKKHFNSYGSRRGNHEVMMRGTFANPRLRNKMADGKEGGFTKVDNRVVPIFEACEIYAARNVPLIIFTGKDYGMGSSRDWAAKGTSLLGVKVVVAESFERIHRSNLIGMGVLPLQFKEGESAAELTGEETYSILGLEKKEVILEIAHQGKKRQMKLISRLDTPTDVEYYRHGGILPYTLRKLIISA